MKLFGTCLLAAVAAKKKKGDGRAYANSSSFLSESTPAFWTGTEAQTIGFLKNARDDGVLVFSGDVWGSAKRGAGARMGNQYESIVNQALRAYAKCKDITLPEGTLPETQSRRRRQAEGGKRKKNKNKKNKKKGESEERGIPDKTPDKLHWSMSWRVALAVRETMMTDANCVGPAFRLFQRLDRYNMNANYQYCKNVADDSVYCQYLKKDSEGNAISYRIARQQGTYTQYKKQGPISVFSPVCEATEKPANANHSTGILFCPDGYSISIDSATYGRKTKGFCRGDADSNTSICRGSKTVTVTDQIADQCNGQTTCVIEASNNALNGGVDPCLGVEKLAEVYHTCYKNED